MNIQEYERLGISSSFEGLRATQVFSALSIFGEILI